MPNLKDFGLGPYEAFERYVADPESEFLESHPSARVEKLKRLVQEANTDDVEDIMLIIMEVFNQTVTPIPEPGNFYTFVYNAKPPGISYDQHPLIACVD